MVPVAITMPVPAAIAVAIVTAPFVAAVVVIIAVAAPVFTVVIAMPLPMHRVVFNNIIPFLAAVAYNGLFAFPAPVLRIFGAANFGVQVGPGLVNYYFIPAVQVKIKPCWQLGGNYLPAAIKIYVLAVWYGVVCINIRKIIISGVIVTGRAPYRLAANVYVNTYTHLRCGLLVVAYQAGC